jgi:hypothetical protein
MSRALLLLLLGIFLTALFLGALSVYVSHDLDQDKIGHLSEAFAGLSVEAIVFSLIISGAVWPLSFLGRALFKLRGDSPRARIGLALGRQPQFSNIPASSSEESSSRGARTLFSGFIWWLLSSSVPLLSSATPSCNGHCEKRPNPRRHASRCNHRILRGRSLSEVDDARQRQCLGPASSRATVFLIDHDILLVL